MNRELKIEPLSRDGFSAFGDVIEMEGSRHFPINNGATERFHDTARVFAQATEGYASISLARSQPLPSPLRIRMLERHPLGSQAFIPQDQRPFVVVVAPAGEQIDAGSIRAFVSNGRQGVNYHPGVWHHSLLALSADQDFVLVDLITAESNCDEYWFDDERQLTLDYAGLLQA
ncbi:ureidoglycolate lyase [Marinobacterium nitratireducens]|uniref:Ureidoglycolate lyase n=1 Tax=Marinobacterium nitratireducens TaxID=518897 RepID=A0A918DPD0_9GAMM|nr:ureidoglycolate lyase [Marinobacterium nitratireducens]GGO75370.1 ureidoglycolate lyase [Marinobacterium nitratireducens]